MPEQPQIALGRCRIAAIVLAAGRSSRFAGGHKLLADARGAPLIATVMTALSQSEAADIILVTAPNGEPIVAAAGAGRWRICVNETADEGLASSIQAGLRALEDEPASAADEPAYVSVLIVLADMPCVTAELVNALIALSAAHDHNAIVFPAGPDGRQGHPVVWPRALFSKLMKLSGDQGAKALLQSHRERIVTLPIADAAPFLDIDTRQDLARYRDSKT